MMKETELTAEKFLELVRKFDNAILVTHRDSNGRLDARPMRIAGIDDNADFWFLSGPDGKVREIERQPNVELVMQDEHDKYVTVTGTARVVTDQAKLDELWSDGYKVWFPDGKRDPSIRLIHVRAERGEYWDNEGINKLEYLAKAAASLATGSTPTIDRSMHGELRL